MDSVTHTLFGLTTYGSVKKEKISKPYKRALLFSALVGSQIPDIDVVMNLTEVGRINEQLWHRGLTHSLFFVPLWAGLIYWLCSIFWGVKDRGLFKLAFINVLIHDLSDSLNTWGTGLLEPIFPVRVSLGTLYIVDFVIWGIMLVGFLISLLKKNIKSYHVYRAVWLFIGLHILLQGFQGYYLHQLASEKYHQVALKAEFIPSQFSVIGKNGDMVEISRASVWSGMESLEILKSAEDVNLEPLFEQNPKAKVLMAWSPFVVVVDNDERLGVFDPRFYVNGESFLYEYILKNNTFSSNPSRNG